MVTSMLGRDTGRLPDCRPLLADPDDLTLVFQPIVDLAAATVAGYEALARFPGTPGPDVWFAAAAEAGVAAELEALAIHKALAVVPVAAAGHLPDRQRQPAPPGLGAGAGRPGHPPRPAPRRRRADRAHPRRTTSTACAGSATSCAGAAPSSPWTTPAAATRASSSSPPCAPRSSSSTAPWSATPTPTRSAWRWPRCSASSPGRIDAWLLAEGIETPAELAAFARLGVPLAQGWLLGRPAPGFAPLAPETRGLVRAQVARARLTDSVASLLRPGPPGAAGRGAARRPAGRPGRRRRASRPACCCADPRTARSTPRRSRCGCTRRPTSARRCSARSPAPPPSASTRSLCTDPTGARRSACCASRTSPRRRAPAR